MSDVFVIGIAGGSGSGKSTFAERLQQYFAKDCVTLSCDDYYFPHDHLTMEERNQLNYDAPEALELSMLCEHVKKLKSNQTIDCPIYDFSLHTRAKETKRVKPKRILIIDGILTFHDATLREYMDLKIYVDADADERVLRRAKRDIQQRGRSLESVMQQYLETVKPMHERFVEPTKKLADIIINGGRNDMAFELVKVKIQSMLK